MEEEEGEGERERSPVPVPRTTCAVGKGAQEPSTLAGVPVRTAERGGGAEPLAHEADAESVAMEREAE
jgi:hypothetical protein